jgi:hypothetical protein
VSDHNEATQRDDEEFLWRADNESIIVPEQRATAVYWNPWGQIVIRRERDWDESDDIFIIISSDNVEILIRRLQELLDSHRRDRS